MEGLPLYAKSEIPEKVTTHLENRAIKFCKFLMIPL